MNSWFKHYRELAASAVRLRPHLRGGRYLIAAVLATSVASAAMEGVGVGLLVPLLALLLEGDSPTPMRPLSWLRDFWPGQTPSFYVLVLCVIIIVAIAAKNLTLYSCHLLAARLKRRLSINLRDALYNRMLAADLQVFEQRTAGEMANVFMTETYRTFLSVDFLLLFLQRASMAGFYLIGLCLISWQLFLLTVLLGATIGGSVVAIYRRLIGAGIRLTECNQRLSSRLMETFAGIRVIRATHAQEREQARFHEVNEAQARAEEFGERTSHVLSPLTETLAVIGAMLIIPIAYFFLVQPGYILPTYLPGFGFILLRLLPLLNQLYAAQGNIFSLGGSVKEVERWMDTPTHPHRPFGNRELPPIQQGLRLEHVDYSYPTGRRALHEVSFEIPAGKTVALVGASGSGKSTVVSLLLRFREPSGGRILIDGVNYWEIRAGDWHRNVAVVEQEAFLFHDTLENNIAFGCPGIGREAVVRAARQAHLEDVIASLPLGLDTIVGERGSMLSGGQRQRLAIARALVRNPQVLILDEATSALDSLSEQQVQTALQEASRGRTVLVIAHRLSTIRHADWIVVLDEGRVREQGTWEALEQHAGLFARLAGV